MLIGGTLGLLGSGGSILTVPLLVYVLGVPPKDAMTMSLAVVGIAAAAGALLHGRDGNVRFGVALPFAAAGAPVAYAAGRLARRMPDALLLAAFALLMLVAAIVVLRANDGSEAPVARSRSGAVLATAGLGAAVGGVTGLLGAGGGFLIVPALVAVGRLPMKRAIGTSLVVIALNCAVGLVARADASNISLSIVGVLSALAVVGVIGGHHLGQRLPARRLPQIFAGAVVLVAVYMLVRTATRL